jgi:hypothetical protein
MAKSSAEGGGKRLHVGIQKLDLDLPVGFG